MTDPVQELQQLKGIGPITAGRLVEAGLVTIAAVAAAGEAGLNGIAGITPRAIPAILAQAAERAHSSAPPAPMREPSPPAVELAAMAAQLRDTIQQIAAAARERYTEELAGKMGRKLTRNMVAAMDALYAVEELLERRPKRSRKALDKVRKRLGGVADAPPEELRKGLKKSRKVLERVIV